MMARKAWIGAALAVAGVWSPALSAGNLESLSFGDASTFEVVTWNIEWFPKSGQTTVSAVSQILESLDADVYALQEIDDTDEMQDLVDALPGYETYYESSFPAGLAYVYKTATVQVLDAYEIYTTSPYWSPFPRSPMVLELLYDGEFVVVINNHFKCCGDGILDLSDSNDEETRRYTASNLLKDYVDANFPNDQVLVVGDLNDNLADAPANNVFQGILDDPGSYLFADMAIASGSSANWSYPNWPSHLDHILITDELLLELAQPGATVETIRVDDYLTGGWPEYDSDISDHRPVGIKLVIDGGCGNQGAALESVRLGTPSNPDAFRPGLTTAPIGGDVWDPWVDHGTFMPDATVDLLAIAVVPAEVPLPPYGTLLILPPAIQPLPTTIAGAPFAVPIPDECSFVGLSLATQAISTNASGDVLFTNALDITIGTF